MVNERLDIMTILYIGNLPKSYEHCAAKANISIITAGNGIVAIERLKKEIDIDVIVCQYNLPGNTGLFLYDKINEDGSPLTYNQRANLLLGELRNLKKLLSVLLYFLFVQF